MDVAVLDASGRCSFASLPAVGAIDVAGWLRDVTSGPRSGDVLVVDGPLGLGEPGAAMRGCERLLAAAGKTPGRLPVPGSRPFAGFVRGSVELAARLWAEGWLPVHDGRDARAATMLEAYPGASWRALAGARLPRKTSVAGRRARVDLLLANGLAFDRDPRTHDELDAALCAWLGWKLHQDPLRVRLVGRPAFRAGGKLREGVIVDVAARTSR